MKRTGAAIGGTIVLAAAIMLAAAPSCGSSADSCVSDSECFKGETCSAGVCVGGGANNGGNNGLVNNGVLNNGGVNNGAVNNGLVNNGAGGACVVDPFNVVCEDDENTSNDTWPGVLLENKTRGCLTGDELTEMDFSSSGVICANEAADIFGLNFVECDSRSFVVEATLTPKTQCPAESVVFEISGYGGSCAEPGENLRCERLEDGSQRILLLVPAPARPVVTGCYFYIHSGEATNVQFDYDLRVIVRP